MSKRKSVKIATQWKVIRGVQVDRLERTLEEWEAKGWSAFQVLGPMSDGMFIIFRRLLTL